MSIFEILMLISFGSAWPFSIYRSFTSRSNEGKSFVFLLVVLLGYLAGILHKLFYNFDMVIYLYILNFSMVAVDIIIYRRNLDLKKNNDQLVNNTL